MQTSDNTKGASDQKENTVTTSTDKLIKTDRQSAIHLKRSDKNQLDSELDHEDIALDIQNTKTKKSNETIVEHARARARPISRHAPSPITKKPAFHSALLPPLRCNQKTINRINYLST